MAPNARKEVELFTSYHDNFQKSFILGRKAQIVNCQQREMAFFIKR